MPVGTKHPGMPKHEGRSPIPAPGIDLHTPERQESDFYIGRIRRQQFQVLQGTQHNGRSEVGAQWRSMRISNYSNQWLYCQEGREFIPPWTVGMVIPLIGDSTYTLTWTPPSGITQDTNVIGANPGTAYGWVTETEWPPDNGMPYLPMAKGNKGPYNNVSVAGTAVQLLAANQNRITAAIQNDDSTNVLYLGKDSSVTTTVYLAQVQPLATWVDPASIDAWWGITAGSTISVSAWEVF